jgi:glycosyltransferase involved in cell wall biosynthesis
MRFSVIIPLYNKAPYVAKAIGSVLAQTYTDYELIIVDDGSKDDSLNVALKAIEGHAHCHICKQENAGVSVTRNNGANLSQGDYLCFLDADDWWDPIFLAEMSKLIEEFPEAGIYGTGYTIVNETKHKTRISPIGVDPDFVKGYINYCQVYAKTLAMPLTSISVAIPRHVFDEMNGFPKGIKLGEDFLLWIHIALKYKVAFLNKPLSFYNQDVGINNRGVKSSGFDPGSFMTFHFDQFAEAEAVDKEVKILLDRLRVYSLLRFRFDNVNVEEVNSEIKKVDFNNVERKYRFYYKAPYPLVWLYISLKRGASRIKNVVR